MSSFDAFLDMDTSKYLGEWVLISDNKVIDHSKDINDLQKQLKKCKKTPLITKIPKKDTLIF